MSELFDALKDADRNKLAAVASILPGAGHLVKGHAVLGFTILTGGNLLMIFVAWWLILATVGLSIILIPPLWVAAVGLSAYFIPDRTKHTAPPKMKENHPG